MIAALINARNQLTVCYTPQLILAEANNYRYKLSEIDEVIACVEVKKVQWYQVEIRHLTVAAAFERKGYAKALLCEAERFALRQGARLLQCTIREDNVPSRKLFEGIGFLHVGSFFNERSGNNIDVFQKVLASAR